MTPSAIVTGGASRIGLAVAERLLDDGWPVAVLDADENALLEAETLLDDGDALFMQLDVTDEEETAEVFDRAVDILGPVGALVNCAAIAPRTPCSQMSAELLRQVLEVNLVGSFISASAAVERMAEHLAIVNLGSVAGMRAGPGLLALGASKAGVRSMSEVMAIELAERRVRVNCVAADLSASAGSGATANEIAAAIAFLLSDEAAGITGQTIAMEKRASNANLVQDTR